MYLYCFKHYGVRGVGYLLYGPHYGIVVQLQTDRPFEDHLNATIDVYQSQVKSLSGFRSATYYHLGDKQYGAVYSLESEPDVDAALEILRPRLSSFPGVSITKADVRTGDQMIR